MFIGLLDVKFLGNWVLKGEVVEEGRRGGWGYREKGIEREF